MNSKGISAMTWSVFWLIFVSEDPSKDRWITFEEFQYISDQKVNLKKGKVNPTGKRMWDMA